MMHIVVVIDEASLKKLIGKGLLILESNSFLLPVVIYPPYPGQCFLTCRNLQYTIGRHNLKCCIWILQIEKVVVDDTNPS